MYTEEEQNHVWLKENWLSTLGDDEVAKLIDDLYTHDKIVTLAELNMTTTTSSIMAKFAELAAVLNSDAQADHLPRVRIVSNGTGHKAVRDTSHGEKIDAVVSHESTRRWSANNAEQRSLDKLAEQQAEQRLKDTAADRKSVV